jgi:hypothetical protein
LDFRGFLGDYYRFKILAHSVDLATRVEMEPGVFWPDIPLQSSNCWPGDVGIGYSDQFPAGDFPPPPPKGDIEIATVEDITYEIGTTGHEILWDVVGSYFYSYDAFPYAIYVDEDLVTNGTHQGISTDIVFNIDGLSLGLHEVRLEYNNTGPSGGMYSDTVFVRVIRFDSVASPNPLLILGAFVPAIIAIFALRKVREIGEKT